MPHLVKLASYSLTKTWTAVPKISTNWNLPGKSVSVELNRRVTKISELFWTLPLLFQHTICPCTSLKFARRRSNQLGLFKSRKRGLTNYGTKKLSDIANVTPITRPHNIVAPLINRTYKNLLEPSKKLLQSYGRIPQQETLEELFWDFVG
jgi:hypothetical protein